jgi:2,3-bisphosphoglycerate-dependent phosphoglycerate mutase
MELEHIPESEIPNLELGTAIPIVYDLDATGTVTHKTILK